MFAAAPFLPCWSLHSACAVPSLGGGVLPPCGASLGTEGTSLPGCCLRLGLSPCSSVPGVAVLGAGSCLAPPHRHISIPGQCPLLQVSIVVGHQDGGDVGKTHRTPERGCPIDHTTCGVDVLCQSLGRLCFPSGPHPEKCGGRRWMQSYSHLFLLCVPGAIRG